MIKHPSPILKTSLALLLCIPFNSALAHPEAYALSHFSEGFFHPWLGVDHLTTLFAIGVWVSSTRSSSAWILLLGFWLSITFGVFMPNQGISPEVAEFTIASTLALCGLCLVLNKLPSRYVLLPAITIAGISHGYVHAAEFYIEASQSLPLLGLLIATALIHILGIVVGCYAKKLPFLQTMTGLSCLLAVVATA